MNRKASIDMTHGPLLGKILIFSLPLMASNVLQLMFNAADVVVVGRFAGHASLAAVGSVVPLVNLFINLLFGVAVSVNVMIARFIGLTQHEREISRTLHTAMVVSIVGGGALAAIGIAFTGVVLDWVSTPADVRPLALVYMRLYFVGTPFMLAYNSGAAALRAKGDTRDPLMILMFSGVVNVILNLIFVIVFRWNVVGVASATVLSQVLSAALIVRILRRSNDEVRFSWRELCVDRRCLAEICRIGIPAGLQACLFSLSNVVIQGAINTYSSIVIAGCSAAESIEGMMYFSMNSFHQACQTFTSQNLGAGKYDRIVRVVRICLMYTLIIGIAQSVFVVFFSHPLLGIYNTDPAVIEAGALRLLVVASVYVIFGLADVLVGAIRGYGVPIAPVVINLLGTCVLRLVWIAVLDTNQVGVEWVYLSYPVTWVVILVALTAFWLYLRHRDREYFRAPAVEEPVEAAAE